MEWIGIGIMIAIGIYIAPIVITTIVGIALVILGAITSLFNR